MVHMSPAMGGSLTTEEYDVVVRDLTNFLEYVGEPSKLERRKLRLQSANFLVCLLYYCLFP